MYFNLFLGHRYAPYNKAIFNHVSFFILFYNFIIKIKIERKVG